MSSCHQYTGPTHFFDLPLSLSAKELGLHNHWLPREVALTKHFIVTLGGEGRERKEVYVVGVDREGGQVQDDSKMKNIIDLEIRSNMEGVGVCNDCSITFTCIAKCQIWLEEVTQVTFPRNLLGTFSPLVQLVGQPSGMSLAHEDLRKSVPQHEGNASF